MNNNKTKLMNDVNHLFKVLTPLFIKLLTILFTFLFTVITSAFANNRADNQSSPYMLDENGNEKLDDKYSFGFDLNDPYKNKNRP
ncbi:hypothetical protein DS885_03905 [Psychromonas sp. B3M02]|uniref:hypothetical protein n=1 Tax=Psychromonas sp. B3M02 TaxID=2267226 RepID=UPI000DEBB778|nr:hypothetical protein [Psychromonas sp. B3M02]RBW47301.1 hypothetical protein DS885_03905 [Psychromonas sp. B3M02]